MKIAFDATAICGPMSKNRGIGNYALSQFKTLIEMDQENEYFFLNLFDDFSMEKIVRTDNIHDVILYSGKNREIINNQNYIEVFGDIIKTFLKQNDIDIFYITSPFDSHLTRYKQGWFCDVKTVATVYDIIPYVFKNHYLADKNTYKYYMECVDMLRWIDEYFVISGSVKADMIKYLKFPEKKIHVIYGAADESVYKKMDISDTLKKQVLGKYRISDPYVMCTGGDDERKNIEGLIRAFAETCDKVRKQYQLVIVCKLSEQAVERYTNVINEVGLKGRVILTNFVSDEELIVLYNLATLMAFPSKYEGFGLPVVEAWMCGTPVLTSTNSSLQEIGGDGAILVDADSVQKIAEGLNKALCECDLDDLLLKGQKRLEIFNWENVATLMLDFFKSNVVGKKKSPVVRKIAMFSPLPPQQSGIADYTYDIISILNKNYVIDMYVDSEVDELGLDNVTVYNHHEFKRKHKEYDRIVYQMGNSLYHRYMHPYVKKYPGIVVLHDYNMRGVVEAMYVYEKLQQNKMSEVLREEGYSEEEIQYYMNHLGQEELVKYEINSFIINYATKVIVHSEYAKRKLLQKNIARAVSVIPLYSHVEEKLRDVQNDDVIFAAFGHVHATKRVEPIIKAFYKIYKQNNKSKLLFVGKLDESLEEKYEKLIVSLGLEDCVTVTGYTTLEEFTNYMDIADVCLNLRYPYNGESSASLMRLLGKGKCVIVNRIGSFAEVPEDACLMIDNVADMTEQQEVEEIYEAMKKGLDASFRIKIEENALAFAKENLDINKVALKYMDVINEPENHKMLTEEVLKSYARNYKDDKEELKRISVTFSYIC